MAELLIGAVVILVCLACEGFFSGTETAFVSLDRNRIKALAEKGLKKASLIDDMLNNPERFFSTTLLGTNMAAVLSNAVATFLVITYIGESYVYLTVFIMTPLILIFGESVPKTVYRYHAETVSLFIIYPLKAVAFCLYPVVFVMSWLTRVCLKPFGLDSEKLRPLTTKEDIENYFAMWDINGTLRTAEKKIVERIFDFSETTAEDIMIPLVNTKALEVKDGIDTAVHLVEKTGYSRLPVYSDEVYNITGVVHAFDILIAEKKSQALRDVMRQPRYVPSSLPIDELLTQLRTEGNSIAIVVDEYGGAIGIVTIEDILEEVVGEIYDEHDREERLLITLGRNRYLVKGHLEIDELNDRLQLDLPKDEYETVAGFLLKEMERIPEVGESHQYENITFTIRQADERSIKEILIAIEERITETEGEPET